MWVFPAAASVVAAVFAGLLGRRWLDRRRPSEGVWCVAMLMFAGASLALLLGTVSGWTPAEYRTYWLLGAVLTVPFLAAGELLLLFRRRSMTTALLLLLLFLTALAFNRVRTAVPDVGALAQELPAGSEVWEADPFVLTLARLYSYPAFAVLILGTLWSAWRMREAANLRDRFVGTLLIAVGATVVAAGSAFAAAGALAGFSATLAGGVAVMFWGFVRATRPDAAGETSAPGVVAAS
jgi:hypothetical protein